MADPGELAAQLTTELDERLAAADAALASGFPGERPGRQPVHTVYVPADRYAADLVPAYGAAALQVVDEHADAFAALVADDDLVARVRAKLAAEPVEDLRVDFEDGYVGKSDADEDADVVTAAAALAESQQAGAAAPFGGIRIKCFEAPTRSRAIRTLTSYVATVQEHGGSLDGWVVTLPKVTSVDQVEAMVHVCEVLDLRFEVQVETPQSILGPDGTALVARMVHAGGERLTGLHYGTYDYSAFCGIAAEHQSLEHPVADHAKLVMQAAAAGTGVRLSDGSTNVLPVGDADDIAAAWAQPPPPRPPLARARLLPGLGPAPGPAADAVRRDVRVLPRGAAVARSTGWPATSGNVEGGDRRRAGDRPRARGVPAARPRLRRRRRGRDARARPAAVPLSPGTRVAAWATSWEPTSTARRRTASSASSATPRATRSATSTCRPPCAAPSATRTPPATRRRCCRPTPRRTPRSPTPRSTASPRSRTTRWRWATG